MADPFDSQEHEREQQGPKQASYYEREQQPLKEAHFGPDLLNRRAVFMDHSVSPTLLIDSWRPARNRSSRSIRGVAGSVPLEAWLRIGRGKLPKSEAEFTSRECPRVQNTPRARFRD
jgi:hypothetical protein